MRGARKRRGGCERRAEGELRRSVRWREELGRQRQASALAVLVQARVADCVRVPECQWAVAGQGKGARDIPWRLTE